MIALTPYMQSTRSADEMMFCLVNLTDDERILRDEHVPAVHPTCKKVGCRHTVDLWLRSDVFLQILDSLARHTRGFDQRLILIWLENVLSVHQSGKNVIEGVEEPDQVSVTLSPVRMGIRPFELTVTVTEPLVKLIEPTPDPAKSINPLIGRAHV